MDCVVILGRVDGINGGGKFPGIRRHEALQRGRVATFRGGIRGLRRESERRQSSAQPSFQPPEARPHPGEYLRIRAVSLGSQFGCEAIGHRLLGRSEIGTHRIQPLEEYFRVPSGTGGAGELPDRPTILLPNLRLENRPVGTQDRPQATQADPEVVQCFDIVGIVQPNERFSRVIEVVQRDPPCALRGGGREKTGLSHALPPKTRR